MAHCGKQALEETYGDQLSLLTRKGQTSCYARQSESNAVYKTWTSRSWSCHRQLMRS